MTYSNEPYTRTEPLKIGWFQAAWRYLRSPDGAKIATKVAAFLFPAMFVGSVADEPLDVVPGLNLVTIGDDFVVWFLMPTLFIIGVAKHRYDVNKELKEAHEQAMRSHAYYG